MAISDTSLEYQKHNASSALQERKLLVAIIAISIIAALSCWWQVRAVEIYILKSDTQESAWRWASFLRDSLPNIESILEGEEPPAEDERIFQQVIKAGEVFRYRVYGPEGMVVFASHESDLGTANLKPYVLQGQGYARLEVHGEIAKGRWVAGEAYAPILKDERFLGAIAVYVDMSEKARLLRTTANYALAALIVLLFLIGITVSYFVSQVMRERQIRERHLWIQSKELEKLATHLDKSRNEAEIANRTKSEFLATMSHELRTPLNAIIGFSEVLKHQMFGPLGHDRYSEYSKDIHHSGTHLLNLIDDILDISKIESGKFELKDSPLDISVVIPTTVRLLRDQALANGISLVLDIPGDLPRLRADERAVRQILLNLLSNAIKFTPHGGKVTMTARDEGQSGICFSVADDGIGIAPDFLEKIGKPFTQMEGAQSRHYDGTGLGLALSKRLVEMHDGELTLESTLGEGTTATVRFPRNRVLGVHISDRIDEPAA
jgi:signal transduction histidine kinase